MKPSALFRRAALVAGMCMALAAAQCVVVAPPPGGGGGVYTPPPPPPPQTQYANASFTKAARCDRRQGRRGGRGFYDSGARGCYACPRGYRKSVFSVRSRKACVRGVARFSRAEYLGRRGCSGGREFKYRQNCYRCPSGYRRVNNRGIRCYRRR